MEEIKREITELKELVSKPNFLELIDNHLIRGIIQQNINKRKEIRI